MGVLCTNEMISYVKLQKLTALTDMLSVFYSGQSAHLWSVRWMLIYHNKRDERQCKIGDDQIFRFKVIIDYKTEVMAS